MPWTLFGAKLETCDSVEEDAMPATQSKEFVREAHAEGTGHLPSFFFPCSSIPHPNRAQLQRVVENGHGEVCDGLPNVAAVRQLHKVRRDFRDAAHVH